MQDSDPSTLRAQRDAAFAEVIRLRQQIQHDDLNIGVGKKFLLPSGREFVG